MPKTPPERFRRGRAQAPSATPPALHFPEPSGLAPESTEVPLASPLPQAPLWFGRYRVLERLGQGGMGEVLLATDTVLSRKVALKRVPVEERGNPALGRRLIQEAHRASRLSNPRIAQIYDVLKEGDQVVLVMEYVPGTSLAERMMAPMELDTFWDLGLQCVEALKAAHGSGLLHRDIKPQNIMITPLGQVKLLDLGVAKRLPNREELTSASTENEERGMVVGTPSYMAPEALLGKELDVRADIFSLGIVFYEMLAGRHPFRGGTLPETVDRILHGNPDPLEASRPEIPEPLLHVVGRMLAKNTGHRYPSAETLLDDLAAAHRGERVSAEAHIPVLPEGSTILVEAPPWWQKRRWQRLLIGAGILGIAVAVILNRSDIALETKRLLHISVLPRVKDVAVLPLEVQGGGEDLAAMGLGLTDLLTDRLHHFARDPDLRVAPFSQVQKRNVTTPEEARVELGSNLALKVVLHQVGKEVAVESSIQDSRRSLSLNRSREVVGWTTGSTIGSFGTDPFLLADQVLGCSLLLLEEPRGSGEKSGARQPASPAQATYGTLSSTAFRFYLQGLGHLAAAADTMRLNTARRNFERALATDPRFALAHVGLAWAHVKTYDKTHEAGSLEAARKTLVATLSLNDNIATAHEAMGAVMIRAQDWPGAVEELERALALDPLLADAYSELGTAYAQLKQVGKQEEVCRRAIAAMPNEPLCHWRLCIFLFHQGRLPEARNAYRKMIDVAPDLYVGYEGLGGLLVEEGSYKEGISALERSLELKPTSPTFMNVGTAQMNVRDFAGAIRAYQRAIELGADTYYLSWINLGEGYYWAPGKRELSAPAYAQGVELACKELAAKPALAPRILAILADVYPKLGEPDSAKICIDRALALSPENPFVEQQAALVLWQLGAREEALTWLEKAVAGGACSKLWLRDSPVFDDWRKEPRFRALAGFPAAETPPAPNPS